MFTTTSRKVLVPFATLVAAGAVAVGSGATFTAESNSAITATAGTLVHLNSEDGATLTITNLKPGASETGELTITNAGSLDSTLKVITSGIGGDLADALQLTIESSDLDAAAYDDGFESAANVTGYELGDLDADIVDGAGDYSDSVTITITVTMEEGADNTYQGTTSSINLDFVTTQTDADDSDESDAEFVDN